MANKNLQSVNKRTPKATPQTVKSEKGLKKNNAGGYVFTVSDLDRAKRFLILGSDASFYQSGAKLTKQNADNLIKVIEGGRSRELVDAIVEISTGGRAAKQDAGLFALAVAASYGEADEKRYALSKLSQVARTGTSLFNFIIYVEQFRGWGPMLREAVSAWYTEKTADQVAFQAVKYRQRDGWTHRDVFRKSHPTSGPEFKVLGEWILRGSVSEELPKIVRGFELAKKAPTKELPALIREYGLTWEMLPTEALNDKDVWFALLEGNVPLGALLRQLPRLTRIGVLTPFDSGMTKKLSARLTDPQELTKARIHPINILVALTTYSSGQSLRGSSTWTPLVDIVDALNKAFYASFKTTVPAGKNTLVGLDVSPSMGMQVGETGLSARQISSAFSLVLKATEPEVHITAFSSGGSRASYGMRSSGIIPLDISPSMRLDDVVRKTEEASQGWGGTDCALPILYALKNKLKVDTFVIITDNDTYAGNIKVHEALKQYRNETGIQARLIVLATTATSFSIADPKDPLSLDIAGFDSAIPQLVTEFSRGL